MLCKAKVDNVARIVLPAISTELFAGPGPGFTKEQFICAVYKGMREAVEQFLCEHAETQLSIILNNWKPPLSD